MKYTSFRREGEILSSHSLYILTAKGSSYKSDYSQRIKTHRFGGKSKVPDLTGCRVEMFLAGFESQPHNLLVTLGRSFNLLMLQFPHV